MSKKEWLIIAAVVIVGGAITGIHVYENKNTASMPGMNHGNMMMNAKTTYRLNLLNATATYPVNQPTQFTFDIRDQNNKVFKNFALDYTKIMHLIVVRKDRTNFRHVHPTYDSSTGRFSLNGLLFQADGDYRIFANFTPNGAQKDAMGMAESEAPYQDIKVGDVSKYTPQPLGGEKLASSMDGFDASIFFPPLDDSIGVSNNNFYAGSLSNIAINIDKNGQPYKNLQTYLGALGHMVVLGPNLEFIHAHPQTEDITNQSGLVTFQLTFPSAGQYKLYLQTQADNKVTTNDFNVTVQEMPKSSKPSTTNSMPGMDMQNMSH